MFYRFSIWVVCELFVTLKTTTMPKRIERIYMSAKYPNKLRIMSFCSPSRSLAEFLDSFYPYAMCAVWNQVTACYWMTIIRVIYVQWWRQTLLGYAFAPEKPSNQCEIVALTAISLISTGNLCCVKCVRPNQPNQKKRWKCCKIGDENKHFFRSSSLFFMCLYFYSTQICWAPRSIFGHKINQVVPGSKPM